MATPRFPLIASALLGATVFTGASASAAPQALGPPPVPAENPITESKRILGKALFWDEQLSSDSTVACGTCHIPSAGGSDPRLDMGSRHPGLDGVYGGADDRFTSAGVRHHDSSGEAMADPIKGFDAQVTGRRAPTMIGAAFFDDLFWDGRATSTFVDPQTGLVSIPSGGALESQSLGPIVSFVEMADEGRTWDDVIQKLEDVRPLALAEDLNPDLVAALAASPDYPALFATAFGDPAITAERIAYALATYQRTLHPDQTPWDLFQNGQTNALTSTQRQGMNTFLAAGNHCVDCHPPPLFSDGTYRNLGLRDIAEDSGRQGFTGNFSDRGKFKVPTLRNVGLRKRFFHHGDPLFNSVFLGVFLYNGGAGFFTDNKDPILSQIFFSPAAATSMQAFLEGGLTDPRVAAELPPFDRPTLRSELGPIAVLSGTGRPGSGGIRPRIDAYCPPVPGAATFRVGVHDAMGGAAAFLEYSTNPIQYGGPTQLIHRTTLKGVGAGEGHATWKTSLPDDPALVGTQMHFRWHIRDLGTSARTRWATQTVL
ncbi:cytochrome-c peroxidase [Saltatorellus ferox]